MEIPPGARRHQPIRTKHKQTKAQSLAAQESARKRRERDAMILELQQHEARLIAEGAEQTIYVGDNQEDTNE